MSLPHRITSAELPPAWLWRDHHWKLLGGGPLFTGFAVALWVIWVLVPQDVAPVAGLSAICLALSVPGWLAFDERRVRVRGLVSTSGPPPALVFTSAWWRPVATSLTLVVVIGIWTAFTVAVTVGAEGSVALGVALGLGFWLVLFLVGVLVNLRLGRWARPALPHVALDADGVVVRGLLHRTRLRWEDHPWPVAARRAQLDLRAARARPVRLPVGAYGTSRLVIGAAVAHYARHAHERHELGTVLAEERLRTGTLAWPYR
ncbi:hypothetical protein [Nocardioides nanhaiensis]|uniref:PH domain-containing protein n=1 Tax=Nocardioides nanhaiensis TaxID=1476871 RepID=A0ABP8WSU9_9ACTN